MRFAGFVIKLEGSFNCGNEEDHESEVGFSPAPLKNSEERRNDEDVHAAAIDTTYHWRFVLRVNQKRHTILWLFYLLVPNI